MNIKKRTINILAMLFLALLVGSAIYIIIYWDDITHPVDITITAETDSTEIPEVPKLYTLPIDSFFVVNHEVKQNEYLSKILAHFHLGPVTVDKIVKEAEGVFDFRKIRPGQDFIMFLSRDSLPTLQHFVYEQTPLEYILVNLDDTITVFKKQRPVSKKMVKTLGSIQSSLWKAMTDKGANPLLAIELSEIYAWSIDFFGLQPGDSFAVLYDELFVDTIRIGLGEIHGAYFRHMNQDFFAVPFIQDSVRSYYDLEGNSLRKAFLKAPLQYSRISSRFSNSRLHPILKIRRPHHGVDYAAPSGTPVMAIGDGIVLKKGYSGGGGNMVKIKHNSVYTTAYLHLSKYGSIKVGDFVHQGDIIGYVGSTGLSTGPHLDFRFYKNGAPIDPLHVEAPPVEPVYENNIELFDSVKAHVIDLLR